MIYVSCANLSLTKFPVGETKIVFEDFAKDRDIYSIKWYYESDSEIFTIIALKDYIDSLEPNARVNLCVPYLPYARMDRTDKEAFTLKTFAKLINQCGFAKVKVQDIHSNVSLALIDRVENKNWTLDSSLAYKITSDVVVVYPDATAEKRYSKEINKPLGSILCIKDRDFDTGKIKSIIPVTDLDPNKDWSNTKFIMVDDLCSYGGTFDLAINEIRKTFKTAQHFELVVGHLEKSYLDGKLKDNPYFKELWTRKTLGWQYGLSDLECDTLRSNKVHIFSII